MNEAYIRKLIRLVEESQIESLEISSFGRKIRITQKGIAESNGHSVAPPVYAAPAPPPPVQAAPAPQSAPPAAESSAQSADNTNVVEIKSPMVGTFYSAPAPDADPYVSMNEKITTGQVVCIVEAMKLMNEIESEVSGRVVEVCVENAQPVEFGQVLFKINTAS